MVTKQLGTVEAGTTYTLSFDAFTACGGSDMSTTVSVGSLTSETATFTACNTYAYSVTFTATATECVTLTLTMEGERWETVTINNLLLVNSSGETILPDASCVEASSSSSVETSSSSDTETSSSSLGTGTSSSSVTGILDLAKVSPISLHVSGRVLSVAGASSVDIDVFDLQGRPLASWRGVSGGVSLDALSSGNYIVRVKSGSNSLVRRATLR